MILPVLYEPVMGQTGLGCSSFSVHIDLVLMKTFLLGLPMIFRVSSETQTLKFSAIQSEAVYN